MKGEGRNPAPKALIREILYNGCNAHPPVDPVQDYGEPASGCFAAPGCASLHRGYDTSNVLTPVPPVSERIAPAA